MELVEKFAMWKTVHTNLKKVSVMNSVLYVAIHASIMIVTNT